LAKIGREDDFEIGPFERSRHILGVVRGLAKLRLWNASGFSRKASGLIIGNGAYSHKAQLANPPHDAEDVATALKRTNFEVIFATDLGQAEMQERSDQFFARSKKC